MAKEVSNESSDSGMTQMELVKELRSTKCRCGQIKQSGHTFCRACYYLLPTDMRSRLYNHLGNGYEEAYAAAVERLDEAHGQDSN